MPMTRKTITNQMEDWVKSQIESGRYGNDSECIRDLLRRDQARCEAEWKLGEIIDATEAGGLSRRSAGAIWDDAESSAVSG